MARLRTICTCVLAISIRLVLFASPHTVQLIAERNEVSTPLNSWKRVVEGIEMHRLRLPGSDQGMSPYEGDIYHETPLALLFFRYFARENSNIAVYLFVFCDILTGLLLAWCSNEVCKFLLQKQVSECKLYSLSSVEGVLKRENIIHLPYYVLLAYLFNPMTIASCVAQTTTVFTNLLLAITFLTMMKGCHKLSTLFLSLATYQCMYPVVLLAPLILHITYKQTRALQPEQRRATAGISLGVWCAAWFLLWSAALLYLSHWLMGGSWTFIHSTYGFIFHVRDTSPNMGLFWYFFTEMFEHFTTFFTWVFQINAFIYALPLAIRFRSDSPYLFLLLLCQLSICKSYPCVGDLALYAACIPMYSHLVKYMRNQLLSGLLILSSGVIGPVMYHLWVYSGSANANFYFAATLAFNTGQVFLLSDLMMAHLRRDYFMRHGKLVDSEGKPVPIYLS